MSSEFATTNNKGLLWDLMRNDSVGFKRGLIDNFTGTQKMFENCIEKVRVSPVDGETLIDINKRFITHMNAELSSILNTVNDNDNDNDKPPRHTPVLAKELQMSRVDKMKREFDAKQRDMDLLLNGSTPKQIDFSLTADNPMKDIDSVLTKKLAERNYDVVSVASSNNNNETIGNAKKWLGIDADANGEQPEPQNEIVNPPTKSYSAHNIFDKLKPSMEVHGEFMSEHMDEINPRTDIHHLLTMVLANQKKIMTHLNIV